jgi:F420 biosynthesis protein FbiB-like protein
MMNTDFWDTAFQRRSIRRYDDRTVSRRVLDKIIQIAATAPSAHDNQPWRFVVVESVEIRRQLVKQMAQVFDRDLAAQHVPDSERLRRVNRSLRLLGEAPSIIVVYLSSQENRQKEEETMDVQGVAVATGYLLLAATAAGLGACWYAAPLFCPETVNEVLGMDVGERPQALITLGYPAETPTMKDKKDLAEIVSYV